MFASIKPIHVSWTSKEILLWGVRSVSKHWGAALILVLWEDWILELEKSQKPILNSPGNSASHQRFFLCKLTLLPWPPHKDIAVDSQSGFCFMASHSECQALDVFQFQSASGAYFHPRLKLIWWEEQGYTGHAWLWAKGCLGTRDTWMNSRVSTFKFFTI